MPLLSDTEVRVLGSLIEKQITTPEYYPLTLNALTIACNQKNNRSPVTSYTEVEIEEALNGLREKNLAYLFHGSTSRVSKYKHVAAEVLEVTPPQLAVLCALMLTGPQTVGEIRPRASRMHPFADAEEVEETLRSLMAIDPEPLAMKLSRLPGKKEARYAHLLAGEPNVELFEAEEASAKAAQRARDAERLQALEEEVATLATNLQNLRHQFEEFKKQFE
jgi:uncharacterized protein